MLTLYSHCCGHVGKLIKSEKKSYLYNYILKIEPLNCQPVNFLPELQSCRSLPL